MRTVGCSYTLLSRDEQELIAYHWQLSGPNPVDWPHVHLGAGLLRQEVARSFGRAPWPTEPITFAAFVRVLVDDLGVEPLRSDWRARLDAAEVELGASFAERG